MCREPRTYRFALGLFNELQVLRQVFAEISALGHTLENICVITRALNLDPAVSDDGDGAELDDVRRLFHEVREVRNTAGRITRFARVGPMNDDVCGNSIAAFSDGSSPPAWLSEKQFRRLHDHISNGGLVLIVSSQSPTQHDEISRVLLCHSQNGVQTHDFTI